MPETQHLEIERKFLVDLDKLYKLNLNFDSVTRIVQGYLTTPDTDYSLRVRITDDQKAELTLKIPVKVPNQKGALVRREYNFPILVDEAKSYIKNHCKDRVIQKLRATSGDWTIDFFEGSLLYLVLAEIETDSVYKPKDIPEWIVSEVSGDPEYSNEFLACFGRKCTK